MLFCFCSCIFVTVRIVCKGITLYRYMPFVYPFKQFDNNNNKHTGKEKGPRLGATQLAETQVAGSLATQKKTIHCLSV